MGYANIYPLSQLEIGSQQEQAFSVGAVAADHVFTQAEITLPSWLPTNRISHAFLDAYFPYYKNTAAVLNYTEPSQYIYVYVDGGAGHIANKIFNSSFELLAGELYTGNIRNVGNYDLVSYLVNDCTLTFNWDAAAVHADGYLFHSIYFILRVIAE